MRKPEQMREDARKYMLAFGEDSKEVWLMKGQSFVTITAKRAIDWVMAGIDDLDCRSEEEMLELLNQWLSEGKK
jgi:hypothetical protein